MIDFRPSPKQHLVFKYFEDADTTELLYGGGVASGKTYLLAALIVMQCLKHPGIRIGLAREHLSILKKNTFPSVFEVLNDWGLTSEHYGYNSQSGLMTFHNGSEIILVELSFNPSDPSFTRLGGLQLTMGVIDEASEVEEKGKEMFQSRIGRWKNKQFNIKPFLLMTCNPAKNFLYREFYLKHRDNDLPAHRKFIQALPSDNPFLPPGYIENLTRTMSLTERRRLINGEWEVTDEADALFTQADLDSIWDYSVEFTTDRTRRISADIAFTSDRCVFVVWEGPRVIKVAIKQNDSRTTIDTLKHLAIDYRVRGDNIAFDSDGVGLYLREHFPLAREIHNGGKPINNDGYKNLKTELFFRLSQLAKDGELKVMDQQYRNEIEEELSIIKHRPRESMTSNIELISKSDMKKTLGRSPDIADALAYGCIFLLRQVTMSASDIVFVDF